MPQAPLFRDPIHDGAADPTIVWNREEQAWWLLYTNRRANVECPGLSWAHGTDIGIASSDDGGKTWIYRGILQGLETGHGRNTYWAPEILWHDGLYHMYVSYIRGVPDTWNGLRHIMHMTSVNLWDWKRESTLNLSSERVIDGCVFRLPGGMWRMWYKDEASGSATFSVDSHDLYEWGTPRKVLDDRPHEGPNVFEWRGKYWMIVDPWQGLGVYSSADLETWTKHENILNVPGTRKDDGPIGRHADVLVQGDDAFIFYFTHPEWDTEPAEWNYGARRTSLQAARLEIENGIIVCDRDAEFDLNLQPPADR